MTLVSLQQATTPKTLSVSDESSPEKIYLDGLEAEGVDVDMLGTGDLEAQGWNTSVSGSGSGGAVIFGS